MKKFLKYTGITIGVILIGLYLLFLAAPIFLNGIANSYSSEITKIFEDATGFKLKLGEIKILTTPKLTAGGIVEHIELALPTGEAFFTADNVQAKLSLFPIFAKRIEIDMAGADNINVNLKIKKDGKFLLEDYLVKSDETQNNTETKKNTMTSLPFGFKLSNHLPNIIVNNYNISFIDIATDKAYSIYGNNILVSDFILNKKIKIAADGRVMLQDKVQFNYDVKILNRVMPDIDLNELVFAPQTESEEKAPSQTINIIDVFKAIHNNQLSADLTADIKTKGTFEDLHFDGTANISNAGVAVDGKKLPSSSADLKFNGNNINMYAKLYTADNELSELIGDFKTGKHPKIELNCKSNAKFKSVIDIIDSIAKSFGCNELDSLTATGGIDADFSVKSDLKKIESSGYLKIPSASLAYKLYNIAVNNIKADIDFSNSMIDIKNAGFTVLNQPLTLKGTVGHDAVADLNIKADKLQLKGLLLALGQVALLNDNMINSGTITANVLLKGRLDNITPEVNVSVDNVDLKNIPSNTSLKAPKSVLELLTDGKTASAKVSVSDAKIINPLASVSVPSVKLSLGDKDINIDSAYLLYNNARIDVSGKISDYLTQNLNLDITAKDIKNGGAAYLKGSVNDLYSSQKLNLNLNIPNNISFEIPGLKDSVMTLNGNLDITGSVLNPDLNGSIAIPSVKIPDMLVAMDNMTVILNGPIARGNGMLKRFVSGGIIAENLTSDFNLANNVFYLKNLKGDAFEGKIDGNISYNISNGHTGIDFKGAGMNAEKAIAGAAGLKNALSGKLNFDAKVTLYGATDKEMMKNLKGTASFDISDGALGNIGRFENMLLAQNLQSNSIIKAAVNSVSALPVIKNTAQFRTIKGNLSFANGWANLNPVTTTGPSMAYYITGRYNLLNATANVTVLGRISAEVVSLLGPLGDLSVSKLTSYIPKFGTLTGNLINALTSDPKKEKIALIPALSSGNTNYKDFKVVFNGGVESKNSVKSFKWLSTCDTSAIEKKTVQEQVQETKQAVKDAVQQKVDAYNTKKQEQKEQAQEAQQQMKDAVEGLKNLFIKK